ncbi:hypothetical protein S40288_09409 [Stachybotrys chartarum IBT 40288]|nr:hypothetical protein S40288_09409 [Stachybotrys chartarum IBT 40288]
MINPLVSVLPLLLQITYAVPLALPRASGTSAEHLASPGFLGIASPANRIPGDGHQWSPASRSDNQPVDAAHFYAKANTSITLSQTAYTSTSVTSSGLPTPTAEARIILHRNVIYFTNWGVYRSHYTAPDVPVDKVTHLVYAFADLDVDGQIKSSDEYSDLQMLYTDASNPHGTSGGNEAHGSVEQLLRLKRENRHLKTLLSIGGWTYSKQGKFQPATKNDESRQRFAASAVQHLADWGFDGLDVDWEYPESTEEAEEYVLLLKACREALDEYAAKHNQDYHYLLTVAASAGPNIYQVHKLAEMDAYVDAWHVMTYDFAGSWDKTTGHQANIYPIPGNPNATKFSADRAISDYMAAGIFAHKLTLGLPLYGRSFTNAEGLGGDYEGVGQGTTEHGVWTYRDLPRPGSESFFDQHAIATWSYNAHTKELVSYDDPRSARAKADYIKKNRLGGAFFWEASGDKMGDDSLVQILADEMVSLDMSDNMLDYPDSPYDNIRKRGP